MVLVDTSIWINLCRKKTTEIGQKIWTLVGRNDAAVCGQVWVEFLVVIIVATAIANDAELWTADRDFDDLESDGLRLFA